jgi:hypothetical protein
MHVQPRESEAALPRSIGIALGTVDGLTAIDQAFVRE